MNGLTSRQWARVEAKIACLAEWEKSRSSAWIAGQALDNCGASAAAIKHMREHAFENLVDLVKYRRMQRRRILHRKRAKRLWLEKRGDKGLGLVSSSRSPQEGGAA